MTKRKKPSAGSLQRLAELTRKIVAVPKSEIQKAEEAWRAARPAKRKRSPAS